MPGSGKTILSATILDHLEGGDAIVLSFFFDFSDGRKQTIDGMLHSLAFQLYSRSLQPTPLDSLFERHQDGRDQPAEEDFSSVLMKMIAGQKKIIIILDALDESTTRNKVISWIKRMTSSAELAHVQLLCTSRPEAEFRSAIPPLIGEQNCVPLDKQAVNDDIRAFVMAMLRQRQEFLEKGLSQDLLRRICSQVGDGADGM